MARRTIYVIVVDRKGRAVGPAALRRLATTIRDKMPPRYLSRSHGDYVTAGTSLRPEVTGIPRRDDGTFVSVPLLKVRADDHVRNLAIALIPGREFRVAAIRGHDGTLIGGKR